ncbi:nucleoside phosphorylase domain-containing protein [Aspergillus californicus]
MDEADISRPLPPEAYTVGIICALVLEMQALRGLPDAEHASLRIRPDDSNIYILESLGGHNTVITLLPGTQGKGAAAIGGTNLNRTFPGVKYHLMVGIGGGVTSKENDIRLGDVVISIPTAHHGGVVRVTLAPPSVSRAAIYKMQHDISGLFFSDITHLIPQRPLQPDVLFHADLSHPTGVESCEGPSDKPTVFCSLVASGDHVIKTAKVREEVNRLLGGHVFCFEMEAAGFMHEFPTLVIRGISNYADSYKNDI